jgi:hypothetical protein
VKDLPVRHRRIHNAHITTTTSPIIPTAMATAHRCIGSDEWNDVPLHASQCTASSVAPAPHFEHRLRHTGGNHMPLASPVQTRGTFCRQYVGWQWNLESISTPSMGIDPLKGPSSSQNEALGWVRSQHPIHVRSADTDSLLSATHPQSMKFRTIEQFSED